MQGKQKGRREEEQTDIDSTSLLPQIYNGGETGGREEEEAAIASSDAESTWMPTPNLLVF